MADLTPEELERATAAIKRTLEDLGYSTGQAAAILDTFAFSARHAASSFRSIVEGLDKYNKEVEIGNAKFKDMGPTLESAQKQINRLTDAAQKQEAQRKLNIYAEKAYRETLQETQKTVIQALGKNLFTSIYDYYKNQIIKGVQGVLGDNSPIQVAADLQKAAIDSATKGVTGFGDAMSKAGSGLATIPHFYAQVLGGLLSIGGSVLSGAAREAAELRKTRIDIISAELEKTSKSFSEATRAGALFAGGITELRMTAIKAGMDQTAFSKVISENREILSQFGGDVTAGAQRLSGVTKEFTKGTNSIRKQLLNVGISIEEQVSGTAEYMAMLQSTGRLRGKQDTELAEESKKYLINLKAISSFTGEDVKRASERAKEASRQAAVRVKLEELGGDSTQKFENLVRMMPASMQKAAQQLLVFGDIVDPELAQALGPQAVAVLRRAIANVESASKTPEAASKDLQENLKANAQSIKQEAIERGRAYGTVNLANQGLATQTSVQSDLMTLANKAMEQTTKTTVDKGKDAVETQDALTTSVSESTDALNSLKIKIQQDLTNAIKDFSNEVPEILKGLRAKLAMLGIIEGGPSARKELEQRVEKSREAVGAKSYKQQDLELAESMRKFREEQKAKTTGTAGPVTRTPAVTEIKEITTSSSPSAADAQRNMDTIEAKHELAIARRRKYHVENQNTSLRPANAISVRGSENEGMAKGGIARGAEAGFLELLHGTEAVVPLPDGRSIPVNLAFNANKNTLPSNNIQNENLLDSTTTLTKVSAGLAEQIQEMVKLQKENIGGSTANTSNTALIEKIGQLANTLESLKDTASAQLEKHEQMIRHLQDQKDISERMLNNSY